MNFQKLLWVIRTSGIIFSAANQTAFQLIYLETILNILKAKDLITKRKGKAFQSLQIKSHPLSSMQKISTSFLFILMDFLFFFFNGWNTQQESLYPRTLPILMKSRFNPRFGTKSRELSWSLLILIFNVKAPHLIVNETDFPPKTDQYCFTLTYLSLYTFHNHLQGTLTKSSVETNSNCHSIKADGLIKSYSEATFPMFQVNYHNMICLTFLKIKK